MASVLGFRIGIDASKFCTNVKKCFYIYVDFLRDRTIQDIENRIKFMLQIDTPVWLFNGSYYLPSAENVRVLCSGDVLKVVEQCEDGLDLNTCLDEVNENTVQIFSKEKKKRKKNNVRDNSEINVSSSLYEQTGIDTSILNDDSCNEYLKENEAKSNNFLESSKINDEVNENTVQIFSREKKKRKKNSVRDNSENDSNGMDIEKHNKTVSKTAEEINVSSSLYEQTGTDTLILNDTDKEYLKENEAKSNSCLESLKIDDDFNKDSAEINDMSLFPHKNMEKLVQEHDGETTLACNLERPKKRHRVRKHKKKQMPVIEHHRVIPPTFKQKVYTAQTDVNRTHIRFNEKDDSDNDKTGEPCKSTESDNCAMALDSSLAENKYMLGNVYSTKWDVKPSSENFVTDGAANGRTTNGTSDSSEAFAKLLSFEKNSTPLVFHRKRNECEAISQQLQVGSDSFDISKYPRMSEIPKEGDIITFKMLKMDDNYTPKISEYIMAKVLSISKSSFQLSLLVLGGDQYQRPKGKFDLDEAEVVGSSNDTLELNWNELYDTRLVYP